MSKQVKSGGACLSDFPLPHGFITTIFAQRALLSAPWEWLLALENYASSVIIWILSTKHKFSIHSSPDAFFFVVAFLFHFVARVSHWQCHCFGDSDGLLRYRNGFAPIFSQCRTPQPQSTCATFGMMLYFFFSFGACLDLDLPLIPRCAFRSFISMVANR